MSKSLIKQDKHFLEFPLWFQDGATAERKENGMTWKDLDGYTYKTGYKPPVRTDLIVLLALLLRSQSQDWTVDLELSRYELLQDCSFDTTQGPYWYERAKDSLERWMHVVVTFKEFYEGTERMRSIQQFHILERWELDKETGRLSIRLSENLIGRIKSSKYFKLIDFDQIKSLRSPLATRLYEILIKTFEGRNQWSCGAKKLAAKIPMKEKYPADIIPKIKTAVGRINEKTGLQIQLTIRRPKRGKAIFDFEKLESQPKASAKTQESPKEGKWKPQIVDVPPEQAESFKELLALMPEKEQAKKTLRELVARKLRKEGPEFVRRNILYANEHAKSNYRVYLTKAFKEDWGEAYEDDIQQIQAAKQAKQTAEEEKRQREREEQRLEQEAREILQAMTPEEKETLEHEARSRLEATNPSMLQGSFASAALKIQMNALLIERLKTFP